VATDTSPSGAQRAWRAACPQCGAPVDFRSAASPFAVCSFCRSTVMRDGDALRRIGQSAELFDDHSPLQLGASGRAQGAAFTLVGRLQYRTSEGTWNEWHALFDNGRSAWLSEDNGRYVMAFDVPLAQAAPAAASLQAGARVSLAGQAWSVASVASAALVAAQGELPFAPGAPGEFTVVDLRNAQGEVGTLDYSEADSPKWSIGRSVALSELAMTGLAEVSEKTLAGRSAPCPSCGTALEIKLASTQSVVCHQCQAVVDVSQGVGGDLAHYAQVGVAEPQIPLGTVGTLALGGKAALPWQVVGYAERCEVPESAEDEQVFWREYLLYHRTAGFAFLVDAQDGWSWAAPITGAPEQSGQTARWAGLVYRKMYSYRGRVTYVLGEFYWRLTKDQETRNTDYQGSGPAQTKRLNREETREGGVSEVVWSAGETLPAETVRKAFALPEQMSAALQRDALPASSQPPWAKVLMWVVLLAVLFIMWRCDADDDCDDTLRTFGQASQEYQQCLRNRSSGGGFRTGGGSYGGYSSGGGHK
jgi:hypothetical protein